MNRAGAIILVLATAATRLSAQDWRTLDAFQQLRGADPLAVRVEYGAGRIDLAPTRDPVLYRMRLRYDAERSSPVASYDSTARRLVLGTRGISGSWSSKHRDGSTLTAALTTGAPLRLALELGAAEGTIELGGLRLAALTLATGATDLRVSVAEANQESLAEARLDIGAAKVRASRFGNLRARHVEVSLGVGALDLDLDGAWEGEMDLSANVALGSMTVRVPVDAGVRVRSNTFLIDLGKSGLEKRGDVWVSRDEESARRHIIIRLNGAFGDFEIIRR
jgi:hypothetical protein